MASLKKWCYKRGVDLKTEPAHDGFIVPGVAICFLLETNGGICMLDSLITNPYVSGPTRDKALNDIVEYGIRLAEAKGYESLVAFTIDNNTLKRAEAFGFATHPHTLITRSLKWLS